MNQFCELRMSGGKESHNLPQMESKRARTRFENEAIIGLPTNFTLIPFVVLVRLLFFKYEF